MKRFQMVQSTSREKKNPAQSDLFHSWRADAVREMDGNEWKPFLEAP